MKTATEYAQQFIDVFKEYDKIARYISLDESMKNYLQKKRSWIGYLQSPQFPVAFLGSYSTGKSTVINAIIGRAVLPENTGASTAVPTEIKKGNEEYAVIYYLEEEGKIELKNLYVSEICRALQKDERLFLEAGNLDMFSTLEKEVASAIKTFGTFSKEKSFNNLKRLIEKWGNFNQPPKTISIENLEQYVSEQYEDALFVDKAEVFLSQINLPQDVIIVDLPGLNVANPRHRKHTEFYVENKAKAFAVVTAHSQSLEGDEIEIISAINQQRPKVLERAFWIRNKWDTATQTQRNQEETNFKNAITDKIAITDDRIFNVSALDYLLLSQILNGEDIENIKHIENIKKYFNGQIPTAQEARTFIEKIEHIDYSIIKMIAVKKQNITPEQSESIQPFFAAGKLPNVKEAEDILNREVQLKEFVCLKQELITYLQTIAKDEFLKEAEAELSDLTDKVCKLIQPVYDEVKNKNLSQEWWRDRELTFRTDKYLEELSKIVVEKIKEIRVDVYPIIILWENDQIEELGEQIKNSFDKVDKRKIKDKLMKGEDIHSVLVRLPYICEQEFSIASMFRNQLERLVQEKVINVHSLNLLNTLKNTSLLPDDLSSILDDLLSERNMVARMKGLCDIFLFNYGNKMDECGQSILDRLNKKKIFDENLDVGGVKEFIKLNIPLTLSIISDIFKEQANLTIDTILSLPEERLKKLYRKMISSLKNKNEDEEIELALNYYKNDTVQFIKKLQEEVNRSAKRSIKNYYEEMEIELLMLFKNTKDKITDVVSKRLNQERPPKSFSDSIERKQTVVQCYQLLEKYKLQYEDRYHD